MTYIDYIKNSFFSTGCAPTFKVHLYAIRLILKIIMKFALQEKKVFIFFFFFCLLKVIPNKWNNLKNKIIRWQDKYLNYLISKDWTKIDYYYFIDDEKWYKYLKEHPERKKYFEKLTNINQKLVEIYLDQERIDSDFLSKYITKYL